MLSTSATRVLVYSWPMVPAMYLPQCCRCYMKYITAYVKHHSAANMTPTYIVRCPQHIVGVSETLS